jgi:sec-independent protein translocase protein TatC
MSLVDHLAELRGRILRALLAVIAGSLVGFWFGDDIVTFLKAPLPIEQPLVFTAIGDPFAIRLRIAIVTGIVLAMPVSTRAGPSWRPA